MKLALMLGRGIEGAGVSKYTKELSDYLIEKNIDHDIFSSINKKWPRSKSHEFNKDIISFNTKDLSTIEKSLKDYTHILLMSIPAVKGFDLSFQEGFFNMITNYPGAVIFFQHDHKKQSLNRNYKMKEFCKISKMIFVHSFDSEFVKYLKEDQESANISIFGSSNINYNFKKLEVGVNFNSLNEFKKPFQNKERRITYLGRFATFKEPSRLYKLHSYLKPYEIKSELIGIERSIGSLDSMFRFQNEKGEYVTRHNIDMIDCTNTKSNFIKRENQTYDLPYVYGPYENKTGLNQLSESLFGASFYHLDNVKQSDHIEYSMLEIIGVGNVPVFDHFWAENTFIRSTEDKFIDIENALYLKKDMSNAEEITEKLNVLSMNENLFNKYLNDMTNIVTKYYNQEFCFNRLINTIGETR